MNELQAQQSDWHDDQIKQLKSQLSAERDRSQALLEALEQIKHPLMRKSSTGWQETDQDDRQIAQSAIVSYEQSRKKEEPA